MATVAGGPRGEGRGKRSGKKGNRTALGDVTNHPNIPSGAGRKQDKGFVFAPAAPAKKSLQVTEAPRTKEPEVEAFKAQPLMSLTPPIQEDESDTECVEILYPGHPQYQPIDVTVKNTFIELPCTPEKATDAAPIAATCPAKYAVTEEERQAWEEARDEALSAQTLFAGVDRKIDLAPELAAGFDPTSSVGSLLHRAKLCKPCAWFHHPKGCQRGIRCEFCHCCPAGEIKRRKKEKTLLIRRRRSIARDESPLAERRVMEPMPLPVQQEQTIFTPAHAQVQPFTPVPFEDYQMDLCAGYETTMPALPESFEDFSGQGYTQPMVGYDSECNSYSFQYWT